MFSAGQRPRVGHYRRSMPVSSAREFAIPPRGEALSPQVFALIYDHAHFVADRCIMNVASRSQGV
jgi:hypothetical protein